MELQFKSILVLNILISVNSLARFTFKRLNSVPLFIPPTHKTLLYVEIIQCVLFYFFQKNIHKSQKYSNFYNSIFEKLTTLPVQKSLYLFVPISKQNLITARCSVTFEHTYSADYNNFIILHYNTH